jgi:hypothetical protein
VAATTLTAEPTPGPTAGVLAWQQRRSVRASYVLILLVLAACAFTDSFVALAELARATGALPGTRAYSLPLMLDGLTLAGTLFAVTRFGPGQGSPAYGYALIAIGSLASLAGNVAHAPTAPGARVIAGAPPLILFLVFEAAAISFRRRPAVSDATPAPATSGPPVGAPEPAPALAGHGSGDAGQDPEQHREDPAQDDDEPAQSDAGPAQPAARIRAERIWRQHDQAGELLTGSRLAELAGISPRYSRSLLAEFRAQPDHALAHANGHMSTTADRLKETREWPA